MSIVNVRGPRPDNCSGFEWLVNYVLSSPSPRGGYFVQHVTVRQHGHACSDGRPIPHMHNFDYWESWPVNPGGREDVEVASGASDYADHYGLSDAGAGTRGNFSFTGSVSFYEDLTLPESFEPDNDRTMARGLWATTENPHLYGGTPVLTHSIVGSWICCPAASPTTINGHTP